jgi:hypothetical protein
MRSRSRPGCRGQKALAALLAAAIIFLTVRQHHSTTTLTPRALVKSESKASEALRAVRAADADHAAQAKGDAERREELYQALRARGFADAAASAAQAREQASNARAAAAERRAVQAEAALKAREQASNARAAAAERRAVQAEAALKAREQASNATQFLKCAHRAKAYGAAWLARTELLKRQRMSEDKNALEYASFHILTESIRLGATALKAVDDSFWVNHISGYEHNVKRREGAEAAENSVNAMVRVLRNKLCIPRTRSPTSTLALIPFYSGLARDGARKDGIAFEDLPNTGNAHSMSSGATKLKTLKAVLCSALSFCKAALVGVCTSRDYESVTELLGPLPAGQARAVLLDCEQTPAYKFTLQASTHNPAPRQGHSERLARRACGASYRAVDLEAALRLRSVRRGGQHVPLRRHGVARHLRGSDPAPRLLRGPAALREGVGRQPAVHPSGEPVKGRSEHVRGGVAAAGV